MLQNLYPFNQWIRDPVKFNVPAWPPNSPNLPWYWATLSTFVLTRVDGWPPGVGDSCAIRPGQRRCVPFASHAHPGQCIVVCKPTDKFRRGVPPYEVSSLFKLLKDEGLYLSEPYLLHTSASKYGRIKCSQVSNAFEMEKGRVIGRYLQLVQSPSSFSY